MVSKRFIICIVGLGLLVLLNGYIFSVGSECSKCVASDLSFASQMRVGGCDDCMVYAMGECEDIDTCNDNNDCTAGGYGCDDDTDTEQCDTPGGWPTCKYITGHKCQPKRMYQGTCDTSSHLCNFTGGDYGECGGWIRQCKW